jgi:hypothetical protein
VNPYLIGGVAIAVVAILAGAFYAGGVGPRAELAKFRAEVAATGEVAKLEAAAKEAADKSRKEKADAEHERTVADLRATVGRLRAERPSSSFVPAAPAGSSRPDLICFDRAEYQRADGVLTAGARGLADEGTAATVDLDTAKRWGQRP